MKDSIKQQRTEKIKGENNKEVMWQSHLFLCACVCVCVCESTESCFSFLPVCMICVYFYINEQTRDFHLGTISTSFSLRAPFHYCIFIHSSDAITIERQTESGSVDGSLSQELSKLQYVWHCIKKWKKRLFWSQPSNGIEMKHRGKVVRTKLWIWFLIK